MREYVPMLQRRSKWLVKMRPLAVGDVVPMVDEIQPREPWALAVVLIDLKMVKHENTS